MGGGKLWYGSVAGTGGYICRHKKINLLEDEGG